jgi:hypothetical protein
MMRQQLVLLVLSKADAVKYGKQPSPAGGGRLLAELGPCHVRLLLLPQPVGLHLVLAWCCHAAAAAAYALVCGNGISSVPVSQLCVVTICVWGSLVPMQI